MNNFLLASEAGGISFIVLFSLMTVVVFALAVWLLCLGLKGETLKLKFKPGHIFVLVVLLGAVIRMAVAFSMRGLMGTMLASSADRTGYNGIVEMVDNLISNGMRGFYDNYEGVFFYPLTMYILSFFGSICSLFWPLDVESVATLIFMKLPFIISDILLAIVVYKITEKYTNELVALAIGGLVAVCPVFMLGAIWPSVYSFVALIFAIIVYLMIERKYVLLVIAYTISLLLCFEAIFLLPIIAVFVIYAYVRKVKAYKKAGKVSSLWNSEYDLVIKLPIAIIVCIVASYLLILPFALSGIGANPFVIFYYYYLKPFDTFGYFTYNGLSLYTLFDKNAVKLNLSFPAFVFSLLFMLAIIAVVLIVYLTKKNRANLIMLTSYILLTINVYFVNSFELTLLPCLAVTLIAFAVLKDKRLIKIFGILALFVFLNAAAVLIKANYFSLSAKYVSEVLNESWMALSIIASLVTVLCHIYYTIVMLDIVMNGKLKKFNVSDNKITSAWKSLIKIKED